MAYWASGPLPPTPTPLPRRAREKGKISRGSEILFSARCDTSLLVQSPNKQAKQTQRTPNKRELGVVMIFEHV